MAVEPIDPKTRLATLPDDTFRWVVEPYSGAFPNSNVLKLQRLRRYQKLVEVPVYLTFWEKVMGKSEVKDELQDVEEWVTVVYNPLKQLTEMYRGELFMSDYFYRDQIDWRPDVKITTQLLEDASVQMMLVYLKEMAEDRAQFKMKRTNKSFRGVYPPKSLTDVSEGGSV